MRLAYLLCSILKQIGFVCKKTHLLGGFQVPDCVFRFSQCSMEFYLNPKISHEVLFRDNFSSFDKCSFNKVIYFMKLAVGLQWSNI